MKQISLFFSIFWIIYFPTCIAYNELPGFSSIDEAMTVLLICYTFYNRKNKLTNKMPWKEYYYFGAILVFYLVYSFLLKINAFQAALFDLIQQIRPWSVIFCTWILNPQFSEKQKRWMCWSMLLTVATFIFYHPEMQRIDGSTRNAPFGQLAICTSMSWYLFSNPTQKNRTIAVAIAIIGLMGMKFKYYGEFGAWLFMLYYMKGHFNLKSMKVYWQVALLGFIVILLGWDRFDTYYVEGMQNEELARPMMQKAAWRMMWDYFPFGTGLGTFATAAATKYYSPLWEQYGLSHMWGLQQYGSWGNCLMAFHGDCFFATFAQIGWFGVAMFVIFWKRRLMQFNQTVDVRYYKVGMMAFFCTFIEWFGDSAFFSGKGMGYLMLMGLCLNANRNMGYTDDGKKIEETQDSQGTQYTVQNAWLDRS